MNLEEEIQIFHPDCGVIFTGEVRPRALFRCAECAIEMPARAVFKFAQGIVEPKFLAALKRQTDPDGSAAPLAGAVCC